MSGLKINKLRFNPAKVPHPEAAEMLRHEARLAGPLPESWKGVPGGSFTPPAHQPSLSGGPNDSGLGYDYGDRPVNPTAAPDAAAATASAALRQNAANDRGWGAVAMTPTAGATDNADTTSMKDRGGVGRALAANPSTFDVVHKAKAVVGEKWNAMTKRLSESFKDRKLLSTEKQGKLVRAAIDSGGTWLAAEMVATGAAGVVGGPVGIAVLGTAKTMMFSLFFRELADTATDVGQIITDTFNLRRDGIVATVLTGPTDVYDFYNKYANGGGAPGVAGALARSKITTAVVKAGGEAAKQVLPMLRGFAKASGFEEAMEDFEGAVVGGSKAAIEKFYKDNPKWNNFFERAMTSVTVAVFENSPAGKMLNEGVEDLTSKLAKANERARARREAGSGFGLSLQGHDGTKGRPPTEGGSDDPEIVGFKSPEATAEARLLAAENSGDVVMATAIPQLDGAWDSDEEDGEEGEAGAGGAVAVAAAVAPAADRPWQDELAELTALADGGDEWLDDGQPQPSRQVTTAGEVVEARTDDDVEEAAKWGSEGQGRREGREEMSQAEIQAWIKGATRWGAQQAQKKEEEEARAALHHAVLLQQHQMLLEHGATVEETAEKAREASANIERLQERQQRLEDSAKAAAKKADPKLWGKTALARYIAAGGDPQRLNDPIGESARWTAARSAVPLSPRAKQRAKKLKEEEEAMIEDARDHALSGVPPAQAEHLRNIMSQMSKEKDDAAAIAAETAAREEKKAAAAAEKGKKAALRLDAAAAARKVKKLYKQAGLSPSSQQPPQDQGVAGIIRKTRNAVHAALNARGLRPKAKERAKKQEGFDKDAVELRDAAAKQSFKAIRKAKADEEERLRLKRVEALDARRSPWLNVGEESADGLSSSTESENVSQTLGGNHIMSADDNKRPASPRVAAAQAAQGRAAREKIMKAKEREKIKEQIEKKVLRSEGVGPNSKFYKDIRRKLAAEKTLEEGEGASDASRSEAAVDALAELPAALAKQKAADAKHADEVKSDALRRGLLAKEKRDLRMKNYKEEAENRPGRDWATAVASTAPAENTSKSPWGSSSKAAAAAAQRRADLRRAEAVGGLLSVEGDGTTMNDLPQLNSAQMGVHIDALHNLHRSTSTERENTGQLYQTAVTAEAAAGARDAPIMSKHQAKLAGEALRDNVRGIGNGAGPQAAAMVAAQEHYSTINPAAAAAAQAEGRGGERGPVHTLASSGLDRYDPGLVQRAVKWVGHVSGTEGVGSSIADANAARVATLLIDTHEHGMIPEGTSQKDRNTIEKAASEGIISHPRPGSDVVHEQTPGGGGGGGGRPQGGGGGTTRRARPRHKRSRHKRSRHKRSRHKRSRHKRSRHKRSRHKRISHKRIRHKRISHKRISHKRISHDGSSHKRISHKRSRHDGSSHKRISHKRIRHKRSRHKRISHKRIRHDGRSHKRIRHDGRSHKRISHKRIRHDGSSHKRSRRKRSRQSRHNRSTRRMHR